MLGYDQRRNPDSDKFQQKISETMDRFRPLSLVTRFLTNMLVAVLNILLKTWLKLQPIKMFIKKFIVIVRYFHLLRPCSIPLTNSNNNLENNKSDNSGSVLFLIITSQLRFVEDSNTIDNGRHNITIKLQNGRITKLKNCKTNPILCRKAGGNMYSPGRGRTLSLVHIADAGSGTGDSVDDSSSVTSFPFTGGPLASTTSEPDLRNRSDDDVELGISLLVAGSPIDDSVAGDDALLDYDSDDGSAQKSLTVPSDQATSAMDIENENTTDPAAGPSNPSHSTVPDAMFHQCCSNRLSGFRENLVSISADDTYGKKLISPTVPIGSLEDHVGLKGTFHGSRMLRGNVTVNQSISLSFDPTSMTCLSCNTEHNVIGSKPLTMCFSDQNFVASLPFTDGNCISVVCVENSSLVELLEIAKEILINIKLPEGSMMLFGSASYLGRCGTSLYASDPLFLSLCHRVRER
jgi:hypothetical protein